jgi:hypothetical protein
LTVTIEPAGAEPGATYSLEINLSAGRLQGWQLYRDGQAESIAHANMLVCLDSILECQIPLSVLEVSDRSFLAIRFSLWRDHLPLDALPREGFLEVQVLPESELIPEPYAKP